MTNPIPTDHRQSQFQALRDKYANAPHGFAGDSAEQPQPQPAIRHAGDQPQPASRYAGRETGDRLNGPQPPAGADVPGWGGVPGSWQGDGALPGYTDPTPVISGRSEPAQRGWRGKLNRAVGLRLSKGAEERKFDQRVSQIRKTLRVPKRVAVISGKGAAGKTSVSLLLGETLCAQHRGMKVVAMSIDPLGNISERTRAVNDQPPRSVMSLAADDNLRRASDVGSYLQPTKTGLRVLGSSTSDGAGFLTPEALVKAADALAEHFEVTVVDFGLNIDSSVYHKALTGVDQLVLVAATSADSIAKLHTVVKTLRSFGGRYVSLLQSAVVVFVQTRPGRSFVDLDVERRNFVNGYGMPVVTVPYDEHVAEGGPMSLELLDDDTRLQFIHVAAEVMERLPVD